MSSRLRIPVEVLMDVFRANDPADIEAFRLTCRHFNASIVTYENTLPTRRVCQLLCGRSHFVDLKCHETLEIFASGDASPDGLQHMYQMFERKTAIRTLSLFIGSEPEHLPDARLVQLMKHFPSVKYAVELLIVTRSSVLPTDAGLDRFERLERILVFAHVFDRDTSFWSALFATKAFRRVSDFWMQNTLGAFPKVDDGEMLDFIADFSLQPAGKPNWLKIGHFADASLDALERRFHKNVDSIRGRVCAVISDRYGRVRRFTSKASDGQE